jgi:hypothetical protein
MSYHSQILSATNHQLVFTYPRGFQSIPPELEEEFRGALVTNGLSIPEKRGAATASSGPVYSTQ